MPCSAKQTLRGIGLWKESYHSACLMAEGDVYQSLDLEKEKKGYKSISALLRAKLEGKESQCFLT